MCPFSILSTPQRSSDTSYTLITHNLLPFLSVLTCILLLSFLGCFITPIILLVETDPERSCMRLSCRHSLRMALRFPAQASDHSTSHICSVSLSLSTCSICYSHKVKSEWRKVKKETQQAAISFLLNFRLIWSQNSHLLGSLHIEQSRKHSVEMFCHHIFVLCKWQASAVRHVVLFDNS